MKLKPYPKYKDSGIEWLGEIPEGWEVRKLRYIAESVQTGTTPPSDNLEYYKNGNIDWYTPGDFGEHIELKSSSKKITDIAIKKRVAKIFKKGTILIVGIGATIGKVAILNNPASSNQQINAVILKKNLNKRFCAYYLSTIKDIIISYSNAATLGIINQEKTKQIPCIVPPYSVQNAITNYLDQKTAKIDELIRKKEKLIGHLREKRQAIISHAVTKGLDPNVKMKDSGIEWLGEIPEGWEVRRLKWVARLEYGSSLSQEEREPGTVPVYGSNGIVGYHSKSITKKPVIIIGRKGSYGKVSYSNMPCFPIDTTYYIDPRLTKENIKWLYYLLSSIGLDQISFDTGVPGLSRDLAYSKVVPLPPKAEQIKIANYLDKQTAKIDTLIKKIQTQILKLKEYRQTLISNVVTGKVKVD